MPQEEDRHTHWQGTVSDTCDLRAQEAKAGQVTAQTGLYIETPTLKQTNKQTNRELGVGTGSWGLEQELAQLAEYLPSILKHWF